MQAVFRLMLATVQADYAVAHFHSATYPGLKWGAWVASNGYTMTEELIRKIDQSANGYKYLTSEIMAGRLPRVGLSSWALTDDEDWWKGAYYELYMKRYNWRYAAAIFLWEQKVPPVMGTVYTIFRNETQPDFSREEVAKLEAIYTEVECAEKRVIEIESERAALRSLESLVRDLPMPSVLLDWEFKPVFYNRLGGECCAAWCNGGITPLVKNEHIEVPGQLLLTGEQMKDEWRQSFKSHNLRPLTLERSIEHPTCAGHSAKIRMMRSDTTRLANPTFLITFEFDSSVHSGSLISRNSIFLSLAKLTPREREIALLCREGKSNIEIANAFGRSVGTIKAELHSVFRKLGVRTRTELALSLRAQPAHE